MVSSDPLNHKAKFITSAIGAARDFYTIHIWPKNWRSKRTAVHAAFLILVLAIILQSRAMAGVDRSSLLYTLVSGDEVIEGPLDRSAYADSNAAGTGGSHLAVADASFNSEDITFNDPEANFIVPTSLGGNAIMAPLAPEPSTLSDSNNTTASGATVPKPHMYTVEDGDTIAGIANKFNISTNTVLWANGLTADDIIRVGDSLTILPVTGVQHSVKNGDTLLDIADKYRVKAKDVADYNHLTDSGQIAIGQKLLIPDGYMAPRTAPSIAPRTQIADNTTSNNNDGPTPAPAKSVGVGWVWPTITRGLSQYFSGTHGHTGVDIPNRGSNVPLYAANTGTVQFTGWLGGYGNLVIINHGNGMQTYYGHAKKILVHPGQAINKGTTIAIMGSTGRSTGPHLHFEIRRDGRPLNPLGFF